MWADSALHEILTQLSNVESGWNLQTLDHTGTAVQRLYIELARLNL